MAVVYYENTVYDRSIDKHHHLRIISLVDRRNWSVEAEFDDSSVTGITLSVKNHVVQTAPGAARKRPADLLTPKKDAPPGFKAVPELKPAPYTLVLTAARNDRLGRQEHVGTWSFSGELKSGGSFHFRTDAILELMKDNDDAPYHLIFQIRVRSKRDVQIESLNTAMTVLDIGDSKYELVSKEILSLYSDYFSVFYYGRFEESGKARCKLHPIHGEKVQDFEMAMSLLLEFAHYRSMARVTTKNAYLLITAAEQYQFTVSIYKRVDTHLVRLCQATKDMYTWDEALLMADAWGLTETAKRVVPLYKQPHDLSALYDRLKGQLSANIIQNIFESYRAGTLEAHFKRVSHICFNFPAGRVIVQINRLGLPQTTAYLLHQFSSARTDTPHFVWDLKNRLVSVDPAPTHLWCGEEAKKNTVPDGSWALVLRQMKDGRTRYMLTRSRPLTRPAIYLGFVVKGEHMLRGDPCTSTGLHHIEF